MLSLLLSLLFILLPPCPTEDSTNCAFNATTQGNHEGTSFVSIHGHNYTNQPTKPKDTTMYIVSWTATDRRTHTTTTHYQEFADERTAQNFLLDLPPSAHAHLSHDDY